MKEYTIIDFRDITEFSSGDKRDKKFTITFRRDDGVIWERPFPYSFISWRCAEYGIDPADTDTLIDVILHEPHIDIGPHDPHFVFNTDEETARNRHLEKVNTSKKSISYKDPENHLQRLRDFHLKNHDPADTAAKRKKVVSMRAHKMKAIAGAASR